MRTGDSRRERDDSQRAPVPASPAPPHITTNARRWPSRGALETGLILVALAGVLTLPPHALGGDGAHRFETLTALLTGTGSIASKYSLLGPIFAAPLWWLGKLISTPATGVGWFNTLFFGLGLLGLYLLLRRHVEGRSLRAFLLLLTLASMFPYHLTQFYGEVFTAVLVAVGLSAVGLSARVGWRRMGWGMVALGAANTPATIAGLVVVVGQWMWARRKLRYALAVAAALALVAVVDLLQRGNLTNTGYQSDAGAHTLMPFSGNPGFSYPFLLGLLSILLSFGKGLVFFTPGLFLPMRRRMERLASLALVSREMWKVYTLWIGFTVGLILIYSQWWAWYGGWFWGPRFFLFACVPASFALAIWTQHPSTRLWVNLSVLGALALATWVGVNGVVFGQSALDACAMNQYQFEAYCQYSPDFSVLWRPLVSAYLFGIGPRFAAVEHLQFGAVAYGVFIVVVSAYLSIPLIRAIARQTLALLASRRALLTSWWRDWRF